jgi:DNA-directed RNA polymerase specialized sigma24 family protein
MTDYSNSDIERVIAEFVHNKMYREILRERLIDGETYAEIAKRHDRSERWVWTLVSKYKNKIFTKWLDELQKS